MATIPDLVIEDGSCVDGANSFVSIGDLKAFACVQLNGAALTTKLEGMDNDDLSRMLFAAMEDLACRPFCGAVKCDLPFPRSGCNWSDLTIPANIKKAQMLIALDLCNSIGSQSANTGDGVIVKSMKVKDDSFTFLNGARMTFDGDGCSPTITEAGEATTSSTTSKIDCLLAPFLKKKTMKVGRLKMCT